MHHAEPVVLLLVLVAGTGHPCQQMGGSLSGAARARRVGAELRPVSSCHPARSKSRSLFLSPAIALPRGAFHLVAGFSAKSAFHPFSRHRSCAPDDDRSRVGRAFLHRRFAVGSSLCPGRDRFATRCDCGRSDFETPRCPGADWSRPWGREFGERRHCSRRLPVRGRGDGDWSIFVRRSQSALCFGRCRRGRSRFARRVGNALGAKASRRSASANHGFAAHAVCRLSAGRAAPRLRCSLDGRGRRLSGLAFDFVDCPLPTPGADLSGRWSPSSSTDSSSS